jgi:hypothetical protein
LSNIPSCQRLFFVKTTFGRRINERFHPRERSTFRELKRKGDEDGVREGKHDFLQDTKEVDRGRVLRWVRKTGRREKTQGIG